MANELNLQIRIAASATEAIRAFSDLRRSLSEIGAAVSEAQTRTAQLAREFRAAQQQTEALRVQYALGQRALQDLAESAGRTSPHYRALAAEVGQLGADLRQSEQSTGQAGRAFDGARQRTAQLQSQMESMRVAVHRHREALREQGIDVRNLASEYTRLQREARQAAAEQAGQATVRGNRETLGLTPHSEIQGRINAVQTALLELRQSGELTFAEMAQAELRAATMANELRGSLNGVGHTFAQLQGDLIEFGAALAMVYGTIDQAQKFETGFTGVAKVVDATTGELSALSNEILAMTREIPMAATDLLAIAEAAGSLGIAAGDIGEFTEGVAKMAFAFKIPAEQAADMAAGIKNAFELSVKQTFALGDAINTLGNQFVATENDILNVDSRIAATANTFGLSAEQASGLAATLLSLKNPPEVAGSAINGLLSRLQSARVQSKDFQAALKAIGTDANQMAADIAANPQQALDNFLQKLAKLDKTSLAEVSSQLIGVGSDASALQALAQHLDLYKSVVGTATNATKTAGAAQQEFDAGMKTTSAQVLIAKNALVEFAIRVGTTLLPMVNGAAAALAQLFQSLADFANANPIFTRLLSVLTPLMIGANALRTAFAALGVMLAPLITAFSGGGVASAAFSAGIRGIAPLLLRLIGGPIGLAIFALTQLADAWGKNKDKSIQFGGSTVTLAEIVSASWRIITSAYQTGADKIADIMTFLRVFLGGNLRQMGNDLLSYINPFKILANSIIGVFNGLGKAVGVSLAIFVEEISTEFRHAVSLAQAAGRDIKAAFSGDFSGSNTSAQWDANGQENKAIEERRGGSPRMDAFLSGYNGSTKGDLFSDSLATRLVGDFNGGVNAATTGLKKQMVDSILYQRNKDGIPDGESEGTQDANSKKAPPPAPPPIDWGTTGDSPKGGGKASGASHVATTKPPEESAMHGFEAGLEQRKIAFERENALLDYSKEQEKKYWDDLIANYQGDSKTLADLKKKSADLDLAIIRKNAKDKTALQQEANQAAHDAALADVEAKANASEQELALGNITQEQHLANLSTFAAQRLAIEQKFLDDKRKLLAGDELALAQNLNAKTAAAKQGEAAITAIEDKAALARKAAFKDAFAPFETAMDGMVQGVLTGQQTIGNAVKNAAASIVTSYAASFIKTRIMNNAQWLWEVSGFAGKEAKKKAIQNGSEIWQGLLWVKRKALLAGEWLFETLGFSTKEAAKTGVKITSETVQAGIVAGSETVKAGAVAAGEAVQTGAVAAGESARSGITLMGTLKTIGAKAAQAAAGAFSWVMTEVPWPLNIILAPVAAAAAFVGTMAFGGGIGSAKGGELEVEKDNAPFILHKKESVLPAGVADNFRKVVDMVRHVTAPEKDALSFNTHDIVRTMIETGQLKGGWSVPQELLKMPSQAMQTATTLVNNAQQHQQTTNNNPSKVTGATHHHQPIHFAPVYNNDYIDAAGGKKFVKEHSREILKQMQSLNRRFVS